MTGVTFVTCVTMVTDVTEDSKYLVAFSTVPGVGAARLKLLMNYFGSAEAAWTASEEELAKVGLPKDVYPQLIEQRKKIIVDQYIELINKRGVKFFTIFDLDYPGRLKNIPDPPNILYFRSQLGREEVRKLVERKIIAVVGTRKVTSYGREVTEQLTRGLVENGFTIVSGMALGVDGVAHGTTLNCGGKTIAVLGAGVEVIYPREHTGLYNSILERGGVVMSEVAPEKLVIRGVFPARNRIISGLSEAVLVTEGAIDSGSLITARAALEQGREVFAVPGPINSIVNEGTNYLLKNGAKLVSSVEDIVEELGYERNPVTQLLSNNNRRIPVGETQDEQKVIDLLAVEPMDFDALVKQSGIVAGRLAAVLSTMEIKGIVKNSQLRYRLS